MCAASGATWLVERLPRKPVLMVLNYHRIGDPDATEYDPGPFSCTVEEFDWQLAYLKRHYRMTTLAEVLGLLANGARLTEPRVLITLDDGYIDNYQFAFPVLRRHDVQGVFFLPTAFTGTNRVPWWDAIAYIVKRSRHPRFRIRYPQPAEFDLAAGGAALCVMQVLRLYRQPTMRDHDRFVGDLEEACGCSRPDGDARRCFLDWDEAREMQRGGMVFGSHTHNHEILSKLSAQTQFEELRVSREILESELKEKIETLAYPVGVRHTFASETLVALRQAEYRAAFSNYYGFNKARSMAAFDIRRCGMERHDRSRWRLQTALGTVTGSLWF